MPLAVSDLIQEDHICNLVEVVVDSMEVGKVEQKYRSGPGNPACSRRMLLRRAIYDEENDQYICPKAEILSRNVEYLYNGKPQYSHYVANGGEYPFREECADKSKKKKLLNVLSATLSKMRY